MRKDHALTVLPNGMILVTGGGDANSVPIASAELYDPGILTATKVNGRGTIEVRGAQVTFDIHTSQSDNRAGANSLSFCDPAAGVCLTNTKVRSVVITGNTAELDGTAHLDDGTKVTYKVDVTDNGKQGASDTISIALSDGYFASGNLTSGDIRIY